MLDLFKSKEEKELQEFMLFKNKEGKKKKEILKRIGKYKIFDINDEVEKMLTEIVSLLLKGEKEKIKSILDSDEFTINLLEQMTNLPKSVIDIDNFKKIKENGQTKLLRDIIFEVDEVIQDYIDIAYKKLKRINNRLDMMETDEEKKNYINQVCSNDNL